MVPVVRLQGCSDRREVLVRQPVHLEGTHSGRTGVATDTYGLGELRRSQIRGAARQEPPSGRFFWGCSSNWWRTWLLTRWSEVRVLTLG